MGTTQVVGKLTGTTSTNGQDALAAMAVDSSGNALSSLGTKVSGERLIGATNGVDSLCTAGEWKPTIVNTNATGDVVVYSGPAIVRQIRVRNTTNAGVATTNTAGIILVKDGSTVRDGAAAAKTPGAVIYDGLDGIAFRTNITLNFAAAGDNPASDGKIEVLYRPLDPTVTW